MSDITQRQNGDSDSAGALLHAERRRQNFSVGDVSRHLKLSIRQVEALERDEYQMFGSPVFVHGFLRNYAKLLGLDAAALIAAADKKMTAHGAAAVAEEDASHDTPTAPVTIEDGQKSLLPLFIVAAIIIAGIAGWVLTRDEQTAPESDATGMVAQPEPVEPTGAGSSAPMTEPGADVTAAVGRPAAPQPGTAVPETSAPAQRVAPSGPQAVLYFDFFDESWVEVTDRYGEVIYSSLNPPGVSRQVSGYPPLTVVIGNAAGTVLTYKGEAIDLAPHTRVDVARLTIE